MLLIVLPPPKLYALIATILTTITLGMEMWRKLWLLGFLFRVNGVNAIKSLAPLTWLLKGALMKIIYFLSRVKAKRLVRQPPKEGGDRQRLCLSPPPSFSDSLRLSKAF